MDVGAISQLIGSVGFPIACCMYLIYMHTETEKANREEQEKMRVAIENNTNVMTRICERIGIREGGET